ncbi:MAG: ABC transporter ATP-binding protein [Planctomycetota bacterium]
MNPPRRSPINPTDLSELPAADGATLVAPPAAELRGVAAGYAPDRPVFSGVSVALHAGRLTALVGPNAAGKSTLLKTLLGQVRPAAGSALLHGRPLGTYKPRALARHVAYLPQRGGSSFGFTVRQTVAMGRFPFDDEAYVDDALVVTDLAEVADRPFGELSGGQQQRALLARAWAQSCGPAATHASDQGGGGVVLADEPVAHLDLGHAHRAMQLLRGLADRGLAVLVVLHSLDAAARWADTVWLMQAGDPDRGGGGVVAAGPASAVLTPEVLSPVYGVALATPLHDGPPIFFVPDDLLPGPAPGAAIH